MKNIDFNRALNETGKDALLLFGAVAYACLVATAIYPIYAIHLGWIGVPIFIFHILIVIFVTKILFGNKK